MAYKPKQAIVSSFKPKQGENVLNDNIKEKYLGEKTDNSEVVVDNENNKIVNGSPFFWNNKQEAVNQYINNNKQEQATPQLSNPPKINWANKMDKYITDNKQEAVVETENVQTPVVNDKVKKLGKTSTRDYLYSLGQSRGMSKEDIDKLISWDNDTGEVTFGGKKIGTPDAVVDGVSYWSDTSVLDNAFNDYVQRTSSLDDKNNHGINTKIDQMWGTIQSDRDKYYSEYDKTSNYVHQDVTKTDEYKSAFDNIMPAYDLKAMQGRNNQLASGSSSNGGNIDSYAAANALRQQAALKAQGQQLAHQIGLETYNARVNNARNILSDLGVYQKDSWNAMSGVINQQQTEAQRLFENDQTAKNNEAARQEVYSNISGTVGDKVTKYLNSNIWNDDGSLVNENTDYQAQINTLEQALNSTTDENEKARITEQLRVLESARNQKIDEQGRTEGKTYKYQGNPRTEASKSTEQQINASVEIAEGDNETQLELAEKEAALQREQMAINLAKIQADAAKGDYAAGEFNGFLATWDESDTGPRSFLTNVVWKNYINNGVTPEVEELKQLIIDNAEDYNIDVPDAKRIMDWFDYPTGWLKGFADYGSGDDVVDEDGVLIKRGIDRGMHSVDD